MDVEFVIQFIEKLLEHCEIDRHRHILEGSASFYAGVEFSLRTVLVLLRHIKSR